MSNSTTSSPQRYILSPPHVRFLPRAWERRPATPFIARNESRKIWKRVPLEAVGSNIEKKWRRETQKLKTRPVKRLRVTHLGEEDNKENVDYVASKWIEEMTTPSPKRKPLECGVLAQQKIETANMRPSVEVDEKDDEDEEFDDVYHTASPELGTRYAFEILEEQGSDDGEGVASPFVLDTVLASVEAEDTASAFTQPTDPADASSTTLALSTAMASLSKAPISLTQLEHAEEENQEIVIARHTLEPVDTTTEQDDTAYLYGFLSRTRARKAAKQAVQDPPQSIDTMEGRDELAVEPTCLHVEDASQTTPDRYDAPTTLPEPKEPEITMSPRRSSRLTTRLPLPQKPVSKLPSKISLKKLTGVDSTAKKPQTPSVAVATRQNTNSNKYGAITVKYRLNQLHAEAKARESSAGDVEAEEQASEETAIKKRKNKRGKAVNWAETLATFQDESEAQEDLAVTEGDAAPEEQQEGEEQLVEPEEGTIPNTEEAAGTLAEESMQTLLKLLQEKKKSRGGMKKLRRLRRLNAGSVNGTPAPKKFTNTNLPVPVGSKLAVSSSANNKEDDIDTTTAASSSPPEAAVDGIQTRTRSTRNTQAV